MERIVIEVNFSKVQNFGKVFLEDVLTALTINPYHNNPLICISGFENPQTIGDIIIDQYRLGKEIPAIVPLQVCRIIKPIIGFRYMGEPDRDFHIHAPSNTRPKHHL